MSNDFKLSVFIGSTKEDLGPIRQDIIDAVLEAGHIPSGMELWAAGHIPTINSIERHLEKCDIHIVVLGAKYGSHIGKNSESYTEWEYNQSKDKERPIIPIVLDNNLFEEQLKKDPLTKKDEKKLRDFRKELLNHSLCKFFKEDNTGKIARDCVNSINEAINTGSLKDDAGWIRADTKFGQTLLEIHKNPFLKNILTKIYGFSTLTKRLHTGATAKQALGQAFWTLMLGKIKRNHYHNMFFESGSTLAYVSDEFEKILTRSGGDITKWKITTNNAMVLLQFLLYTHINVSPKPPGAPEEHYGAMFDEVLLENPEAAASFPRSLFTTEKEAIRKTVKTLQHDKADRLYLITASGLDIDHPIPHFRGPHVGSHPNMLFKRAIFKTGQPIVLFLDELKLNKKFEIGHCFPVFDPDFSWEQARMKSKLAICIGYGPSGSRYLDMSEDGTVKLNAEMAEIFKGFDIEYASKATEKGGALIIANKSFINIFKKE